MISRENRRANCESLQLYIYFSVTAMSNLCCFIGLCWNEWNYQILRCIGILYFHDYHMHIYISYVARAWQEMTRKMYKIYQVLNTCTSACTRIARHYRHHDHEHNNIPE